MYLRKPVKHQHSFHDSNTFADTVAAIGFGQYVIVFHSGHFMIIIYTVGCDSIKITMATEQVRDATSLILAMTLKQDS